MSKRGTTHPQHGWNLKEKKALYQALETHGDDDLNVLHQAVPTKTKLSIKKYLSYYKASAIKTLQADDDTLCGGNINVFVKKMTEFSPEAPICKWLEALTEHNRVLDPTISCALRLIAHLEQHPNPEDFFKIDLKNLYLYLADALAGETPIKCNTDSRGFLTHALIYLATKCKKYRRVEDVEFIQNITRIFPQMINVQTSNDPSIPSAIDEMHASHIFNPLGVKLKSLEGYQTNT